MKITNLITLCAFFTTISPSAAALLITFEEVESHVELTVTGTLTIDSSWTWNGDEFYTSGISAFAPLVLDIAGGVGENFIGTIQEPDFFPTNNNLISTTNQQLFGIFSGTGEIYIGGNAAPGQIADNGMAPALGTVFSPTTFATLASQDFDTLDLTSFEGSGPIDLWEAYPNAPETGIIRFQVGSVPEPSSISLLGIIGIMSLIHRPRV